MCGIITSWNAAEKWDLFEYIVLIKCGTLVGGYHNLFFPNKQVIVDWLILVDFFCFFSTHVCLLFGIDHHARCLHTLLQPLPSHPSPLLHHIVPPWCHASRTFPNWDMTCPGTQQPNREGGVLGVVDSGQSLQPVLVASWSQRCPRCVAEKTQRIDTESCICFGVIRLLF